MKESKLFNILRTFTEEEITLFEKFLASPFHRGAKNCLPMFKQIKKFYPDFRSDKLTGEYIYSRIYPGRKFNKQVIWNLISETERMTRGFLEQIGLRKDNFYRKGLLLSESGKRKLLNNYPDTIETLEKNLAGGGIDYFYIEKSARLEGHKLDYFYLMDKVRLMADSKLKDSEYHVLLFLRMLSGGLHDMSILNRNYNLSYNANIPLELAKHMNLGKITGYAVRNGYKYSFLIEIYYHSISMILKPGTDVHFKKLLDLYKKHYNRFTVSEKRNMMYWLLNYCYYREENEEAEYGRIIFELNKFRLKEGLVFYPGKQIPKGNFRNIFNSAINAGEIKWAEKFIKEYSVKLQKDYQFQVSSLAYASLYFSNKKYGRALESLNKAVFTDLDDKIMVKTLIAKTYYETGETESLMHHIDSFNHFLKNNQRLNPEHQKSYRIFLNYLRKLVLIKENYNREQNFRLTDEIKNSKIIYGKKWLLEKYSEFNIS